MPSSHTVAAEAGFLVLWLIETLILVYFLTSIIAEPLIDTIRKTQLLEFSSTIRFAYLPTTRLCDMLPHWPKSGCLWMQAKSRQHLLRLKIYGCLFDWLMRSYRGIQAMPQEARMQTGIYLTKVTLYVTQTIDESRIWVSALIASIYLWILKNQTWEAHHVIEEVRNASFHLPLGDGYRLQIPTTEIQGVLDTITIHKAYYVLISSSLTFRQLRPTTRSAILSRIVYDIVNYDKALGHIWSLTKTFALAAEIIQHQLNADWFDKSLQLQLADAGVKSEENESDVTATFISIVFLISCGFPVPAELGAGATKSAKESIDISREITTSVACSTTRSTTSTSQRTRNSILPGYSRQWHAVIRE